MAPCAVVGCPEEGRAGQCLGDGSWHHHGRIHYDCDRVAQAEHGLVFHEEGWHLMCWGHQAALRRAMEAKGLLPEGMK